MVVADTNVVSEALRPNGSPVVRAWFGGQRLRDLYLTTTSLAELLVGVATLPEGRRKARLAHDLSAFFKRHFGDRLLTFDRQAAEAYASLTAQARRAGNAVSVSDGQIAAIAWVHGFTVATRDVRPFTACGLPLINPWEHDAPAP